MKPQGKMPGMSEALKKLVNSPDMSPLVQRHEEELRTRFKDWVPVAEITPGETYFQYLERQEEMCQHDLQKSILRVYGYGFLISHFMLLKQGGEGNIYSQLIAKFPEIEEYSNPQSPFTNQYLTELNTLIHRLKTKQNLSTAEAELVDATDRLGFNFAIEKLVSVSASFPYDVVPEDLYADLVPLRTVFADFGIYPDIKFDEAIKAYFSLDENGSIPQS